MSNIAIFPNQSTISVTFPNQSNVFPTQSKPMSVVAFTSYVSGISVTDSGGDMLTVNYDPAGINEQLVGLTATQSLTNKTIDVSQNTLSNIGADSLSSDAIEDILRYNIAMSA